MADKLLAVSAIVLVMIEDDLSDDHRPLCTISAYFRITNGQFDNGYFRFRGL